MNREELSKTIERLYSRLKWLTSSSRAKERVRVLEEIKHFQNRLDTLVANDMEEELEV